MAAAMSAAMPFSPSHVSGIAKVTYPIFPRDVVIRQLDYFPDTARKSTKRNVATDTVGKCINILV